MLVLWKSFYLWNLKLGIWNLKLRIWNLKLGIENLKFGIESLKKWYLLSLVISKNFFFKVMKFFCNWWHLFFFFLTLKNFHSSFLIFLFLKRKEKRIFFGSWLSNSGCKTKRGAEFWSPFPFFFFFFFLLFSLLSSFFLLPPLLLFTSFFHLNFLLHYTISSLKKLLSETFQPSFTHLPQYLFISLCSWPFLLHTHFVKLISKLSFSFHYQWHRLPIGLPFSHLMGKNTTHLLNGMIKKGSFMTPRPMLNTLKWASRWVFIFLFLCWEICWFHASLKVWCWDIVIWLLFALCWKLGHGFFGNSCDHVVILALGTFWIVELFFFFFFFFWHGVTWTILMAHEFWQCMSCGILGWI